jgi:RecA/RadA recombinase
VLKALLTDIDGTITDPSRRLNTGAIEVMAVNVQLPEDQGGLNGSAIYIDTENTFRPERIEQMVHGLGIDNADPQEFLNNIHIARAHLHVKRRILAGSRPGKISSSSERI